MKTYAHPLVLALAAAALIASVAALYVHYRILRDPAYTSFCDVSETVSCQEVLESSYGRVLGVPVAAGGAIWSALVFLLALHGGRATATSPSNTLGYIFLLSVVGLAAVLYLGYASFFILKKACPLCMIMYVSVIGIFLVSGAAAPAAAGGVPSRVGRDLRALRSSPLALALATLWLVGSISLVAFFPRDAAAPPATASVGLPTEVLQGQMLTEFEKWIDAQPRVELNVPSDGARVVVVKFNDYQCPACRETYIQYKGIIAGYRKSHPGEVAFITKDFPLEAECNSGSVHPAACEAAAAVRMARAHNKAEALEEWLFEHQETMTPQAVKDGAREIAQVTDFDAQYPKILQEVRADAEMGRKLEIHATPTFFVNGIKIQGGLRPIYFDALIAHELKRTE